MPVPSLGADVLGITMEDHYDYVEYIIVPSEKRRERCSGGCDLGDSFTNADIGSWFSQGPLCPLFILSISLQSLLCSSQLRCFSGAMLVQRH